MVLKFAEPTFGRTLDRSTTFGGKFLQVVVKSHRLPWILVKWKSIQMI